MIASVIIDINNININKMYSYNVKKTIESEISIGQRVYVNFNHMERLAFVIKLTDGYNKSYKEISKIRDVEPYLTNELLNVAISLANNSVQTYQSIFNMILPNALKANYRSYLTIIDERVDEELKRKFIGGKYYYDALDENIKIIKKNLKKGYLKNNFEITDRVKIKTERFVKVLRTDVKTKKQQELIDLISNGTDSYKDLKELGYQNVMRNLEKKAIIYYENRQVNREVSYLAKKKKVVLNTEQNKAFNDIKATFNTKKVTLLHGITSSGKTEVYLNLIEECLKNHQKAIFLVPEISLTVQMLKRFYGRFTRISVVHSKLSIQKQYEEYLKILHGEVDVVIGARSAIFMPISDLGIIIVDECHSESYHQDTMPCYDLKDIAKLRGIYNNCPTVLGSATPRVSDYYLAVNNSYQLVEIKNRALEAKLPKISIVDMKKNQPELISNQLDELIRDRIAKNEQIILLHNRRGYSNYLMCTNCGKVKKCHDCDISLTYYKEENILRCHYCGRVYPVTACECGSTYRYVGYGTEQVEEILKETYQVKVLRMDRDTTRRKGSMEKIINKFEEHEATILLGTTMISKGLDFDNVSLVGVLNADTSLNISSFYSAENTYELLSQVSGRSGRRDKQGEVIIQTYNPENYVFKNLNDYKKFYLDELAIRKLGDYPPFKKVCLVEIRANDLNKLQAFSYQATKYLKSVLKKSLVIGPSEPIVPKIKGKHIMNIMIKYNDEALYSPLSEILYANVVGISVKVEFNPMYI